MSENTTDDDERAEATLRVIRDTVRFGGGTVRHGDECYRTEPRTVEFVGLVPQFQPSQLSARDAAIYDQLRELHDERGGMLVIDDVFEPAFEVGEELALLEVVRRQGEQLREVKAAIQDAVDTLCEIFERRLESERE